VKNGKISDNPKRDFLTHTIVTENAPSCARLSWSNCHLFSSLHVKNSLHWFERRRHSIANCGRMVTDSATVTTESL